jgi:glycosyltransferase involved in cell wall biosynthesis
MRIAALPRDPNPYQRLLYGEMEKFGVDVCYLGQVTGSRTCNLLLLPLETLVRRLTGTKLVHLHWVFDFVLPGAGRFPALRWLTQAWFLVWLATIRLAGMRLVWTAHNVLPHSRVFHDDAAARRLLARHADLIIAHSQAALAELAAIGAVPVRSLVVRHGPLGPAAAGSLRVPGSGDRPRRFVFFGKIAAYKGVQELVSAFTGLPSSLEAELTVAGQCDDPSLREQLTAASDVIDLRLERIPDEEIGVLMENADVVVLPFRRITTSGSAELALAHGRPLIVPDLPGLLDIPAAAAVRYDGSVAGLTAAIAELAGADRSRLAAMSAAALDYSGQASWPQIAVKTLQAMEDVVADGRSPRAEPRLDLA